MLCSPCYLNLTNLFFVFFSLPPSLLRISPQTARARANGGLLLRYWLLSSWGGGSPKQPNMIDCNSIKTRRNLYQSLSDTFILFALSIPISHIPWYAHFPCPLQFYSSRPGVLSLYHFSWVSLCSAEVKDYFCWLRLRLGGHCLESAHKLWCGDTLMLSIKNSLTLKLDYYLLFTDPNTLWTNQWRVSLSLHCLSFGLVNTDSAFQKKQKKRTRIIGSL